MSQIRALYVSVRSTEPFVSAQVLIYEKLRVFCSTDLKPGSPLPANTSLQRLNHSLP